MAIAFCAWVLDGGDEEGLDLWVVVRPPHGGAALSMRATVSGAGGYGEWVNH